jgi:SAM-dependent methyltransferase
VDRTRYSSIAHRDHSFYSPLSEQTVDALIERLQLVPSARVLDVGCGKAEMLVRAVERYAASGVGIEPNRSFIERARRHARVVLHAADVQDVQLAGESFDAAFCIGSTHAFGKYADALRELAALLRNAGCLMVGEGYWKRPPDPRYLDVLGGGADEFTSHEANIRAGEALGLRLRFAATSSEAEWDAYEGLYAASIERFAAEHPADPDRDAMLERSRGWYASYNKWGRSTLGFGVYLFEKP